MSIDECTTCIERFYSSEPGASTCFACQPGTHVNEEYTECLVCSPGQFSGVASPACTECELGKLAEDEGNSECTKCPDYQTSSAGSFTCECIETFISTIDLFTNKLSCTCAPGMTLENGVCVPCAAGFYKSSTSLGACTNCNKFAIEGAVQSSQPASSPLSCICSKGDFRVLESQGANSTKIGQCKLCPEGTLCQEAGAGVTIEELPLRKGFWRSDFNSSNVVKCYTEDACSQSPSTKSINSANPIDVQCADDHTGPICNVCLPGYAKNFLGNCETCQHDNFHIPLESAVFMLTIITILFATIVFYVKNKRDRH